MEHDRKKVLNSAKILRNALALTLVLGVGGAAVYLSYPYLKGWSSMDSVHECIQEGGSTSQVSSTSTNDTEAHQSSEPQWPEIDWNSLRKQNPDVVAWVRVPGTRVDYPIVQANARRPTYYLEHDINKQPSYYGCPYLDSDTDSNGGIEAAFAVIYGHHLINGQMFSDFAKMSSGTYAASHSTILLLTPNGNKQLNVCAINVVDANRETIQTTFESSEEMHVYLSKKLQESEIVLDGDKMATGRQVFCFVTCSYATDNERTLVYAAE